MQKQSTRTAVLNIDQIAIRMLNNEPQASVLAKINQAPEIEYDSRGVASLTVCMTMPSRYPYTPDIYILLMKKTRIKQQPIPDDFYKQVNALIYQLIHRLTPESGSFVVAMMREFEALFGANLWQHQSIQILKLIDLALLQKHNLELSFLLKHYDIKQCDDSKLSSMLVRCKSAPALKLLLDNNKKRPNMNALFSASILNVILKDSSGMSSIELDALARQFFDLCGEPVCGDEGEWYYSMGREMLMEKVLNGKHFLPSVMRATFPASKEDMFKRLVAADMTTKYKSFYNAHKQNFHAFCQLQFGWSADECEQNCNPKKTTAANPQQTTTAKPQQSLKDQWKNLLEPYKNLYSQIPEKSAIKNLKKRFIKERVITQSCCGSCRH